MAEKRRDKKKKRSTAEAAQRRAEQHKSGFSNTCFDLPSGTKTFSIKNDNGVRIDILPYEVGKGNPWADEGMLYYERTYWRHTRIGAEQNSYVCLAKTAGKKCPICDYITKLRKDPNADEDMIKALAPKERQLFNIIDVDNPDKGIQVWDISNFLFGVTLDA